MEKTVIDAIELADLQAQQAARQKRTDLGPFRDQIEELMRLDISLPLVLGWLKNRQGFKTTLSALRRYVVRTFGSQHYSDYVDRNGWKKARTKSALNNVQTIHDRKNIYKEVNKNSVEGVNMDGVTQIQQILNAPAVRYPPRKK